MGRPQRDLLALAAVVEADWAKLKAAYDDRQRKLQDANRSAQFYADSDDAEEFIAENQVQKHDQERGRKEERARGKEPEKKKVLTDGLAHRPPHLASRPSFRPPARPPARVVSRLLALSCACLLTLTYVCCISQVVVNSFEATNDEETALNMLKKQAAVQGDIDSFEFSIKALRALAESLVASNHFDKENIDARRVRSRALHSPGPRVWR